MSVRTTIVYRIKDKVRPYAAWRNFATIHQTVRGPPSHGPSPLSSTTQRFESADCIRRSSFDFPTDFTVDDYFDGAFGLISGTKRHHVIVELDKSVQADARTRRWHAAQITTPLPSGRTRIEFEVSSLREVVAWILEWGSAAEAIQPPELRDRVASELRTAWHRYM